MDSATSGGDCEPPGWCLLPMCDMAQPRRTPQPQTSCCEWLGRHCSRTGGWCLWRNSGDGAKTTPNLFTMPLRELLTSGIFKRNVLCSAAVFGNSCFKCRSHTFAVGSTTLAACSRMLHRFGRIPPRFQTRVFPWWHTDFLRGPTTPSRRIGERLQRVRRALATCARPQRVLERCCCSLCGHCTLFRDGPCNGPSKHIADHNPSDPTLWFLQSCEASHSQNLKGHLGHTTSGNEHCDMAPIRLQNWLEVLTSHSRRLRALRKLRQKTSSSRSKGLSGTRLATSGGKGSRAVGGRRSRFLNSFNVFLFPGANPKPAVLSLFWRLLLRIRAASINNFHCPEKKTSRTWLPTFSLKPTPRHGRPNNMRGKRKKSFHPRSCFCSSPRS